MDALSGAGVSDEVRALLLLDLLPDVGPVGVGRLVSAFGSARKALVAPANPFLALTNRKALEARGSAELQERLDEALARASRSGMSVVSWDDADYPDRLERLADPPPVLFLRGRGRLLRTPGVAVVGARRATIRGREVARELGRALATAGIPVISGLALGVDGAAHAGAVSAPGPTVAVMGSGADRAYPRSHRRLFRSVVRQGLVVSEFLPGTPALPRHFPRRNRILAALAHTVVVVEAAAKSGSLITVDHALDLGLDVYAVPGPIDTRTCQGSNRLLREGARPLVSVGEFVAGMVEEHGHEVARTAGPDGARAAGRRRGPEGEAVVHPPLQGDLARVAACLEAGTVEVDAVARATGLPAARALALLTRLELQGRVRRLPGPRFRRAG